jgi:hypothetical protein
MRALWEFFTYKLPANPQVRDIVIQFRISHNMAITVFDPSGGIS